MTKAWKADKSLDGGMYLVGSLLYVLLVVEEGWMQA